MLRTTSSLPLAAAGIAVAMAIAACGSTSPSTSSASSTSRPGGRLTYAQAQHDAVNFAHCMRSHGVSDFPDPTASPGTLKFALRPGSAIAQSPAFQPAYAACQHLLPGGGPGQETVHSRAQIAAFLAFAGCLRSHGFSNFPDPTSSGQLTHEMLANAGINLHQPAFLQAADGCVGVTHGLLTKADVARFVAGQ